MTLDRHWTPTVFCQYLASAPVDGRMMSNASSRASRLKRASRSVFGPNDCNLSSLGNGLAAQLGIRRRQVVSRRERFLRSAGSVMVAP
jgi:hypothetical protein